MTRIIDVRARVISPEFVKIIRRDGARCRAERRRACWV
jgi:hypothetical protein